MTWDQASDKVLGNVERILSQEVMLFQGELLRNWAVDTGFSRRGWMLKRDNKYKYTMTNDVSYAPFVWLAERPSVTKPDNMVWWHGKGGQAIFDKVERRLTERLQREYAK